MSVSEKLACVKGGCFVVILFITSFVGVCMFNAVLMPLCCLPKTHRIYRRVADSLVYSWIMFCVVSCFPPHQFMFED